MNYLQYKHIASKNKRKKIPSLGTKYEKDLKEDQICIQIVVPLLNLWEKTGLLKARWNKITNEAADKNLLYGVKLKRMGKKAGMGDYLFEWGTGSGWIEVKTKTGRQSPSQKKFEAECKEWGIGYEIIRTWEELEAALKKWGILDVK